MLTKIRLLFSPIHRALSCSPATLSPGNRRESFIRSGLLIGFDKGIMRTIDLSTWPRRKHFEVFSAFDYPHINLCANVEITAFYSFVKQQSLSLNITLVYLFARVANAIPEFRYRIRDGQVVEHDVVHPSTTILTEDDLFSFCTIPYVEDYATFVEAAEDIIAHIKSGWMMNPARMICCT